MATASPCDGVREQLEAWVDGELSADERTRIEAHTKECADCRAAAESIRALGQSVRSIERHAPPDGLTENVRAALRARGAPHGKRRAWLARTFWASAGAAATIAVLLGWSTLVGSGHRAARDRLAEEIVSAHVRSLLADHLTDQPSSDEHQVKPWFTGKLDFSPPVAPLDAHGFALLGGRLDYLNHRVCAALVYRRRQHVINLFVCPSPADASLSPARRRGYGLVAWREREFSYFAVADLNDAELGEFARLVREQNARTR